MTSRLYKVELQAPGGQHEVAAGAPTLPSPAPARPSHRGLGTEPPPTVKGFSPGQIRALSTPPGSIALTHDVADRQEHASIVQSSWRPGISQRESQLDDFVNAAAAKR